MAEEQKGEPRDFVYIGDRPLQGGGTGTVIHWIDGEVLGERAVFKLKRGKGLRVIGGVHTGARYDGTTAYGLSTARYVRKWPDAVAVAAWEAEDAALNKEAKLKRLVDNDAKDSAFDKLTIAQVRDMRHAALHRGDYTLASALMSMARMRIERRPTKTEQQDE